MRGNTFGKLLKHGVVVGCIITGNIANLVGYPDVRNDFEQGLAEPHPIMSVIQTREAKKSSLNLPLPLNFLYPRPCHRKIPIGS